eukprot:6212861-Pleurochrysis_carterae.AAC.1
MQVQLHALYVHTAAAIASLCGVVPAGSLLETSHLLGNAHRVAAKIEAEPAGVVVHASAAIRCLSRFEAWRDALLQHSALDRLQAARCRSERNVVASVDAAAASLSAVTEHEHRAFETLMHNLENSTKVNAKRAGDAPSPPEVRAPHALTTDDSLIQRCEDRSQEGVVVNNSANTATACESTCSPHVAVHDPQAADAHEKLSGARVDEIVPANSLAAKDPDSAAVVLTSPLAALKLTKSALEASATTQLVHNECGQMPTSDEKPSVEPEVFAGSTRTEPALSATASASTLIHASGATLTSSSVKEAGTALASDGVNTAAAVSPGASEVKGPTLDDDSQLMLKSVEAQRKAVVRQLAVAEVARAMNEAVASALRTLSSEKGLAVPPATDAPEATEPRPVQATAAASTEAMTKEAVTAAEVTAAEVATAEATTAKAVAAVAAEAVTAEAATVEAEVAEA